MAEEFEVFLQGGSPWGFRLKGGKEFREPLKISKVEPGGKAGIGGVKVGDQVIEINGTDTSNLYHTEALTTVKKAQYSLSLVLKRPEDNNNNSNEPAHTIQSVSLAPEDSKTRVSLTIAPKSSSSSTSQPTTPRYKYASQDSLDSAPTKRNNVPSGQGYMQKLVGSLNDLDDDSEVGISNDLPPQDRVRSKTLPKSYGKKKQEESNRRPRDNDQYTSSLPRSDSSGDSGPPNKAPHWYKDMYKQMHTSMEGESHLSKLLSSDAKRGAFKKYDSATSPLSQRSLSPDERRSSFGQQNNDAPRRLQGGRSLSNRNHPHRKSLPNIHAANFNFMNPDNYSKNSSPNSVDVQVDDPPASRNLLPWQRSAEDAALESKPTTTNSNAKKAVNSEWYRNLQKGGDIPETGLANKNTEKSVTDGPIKKPASSTNVQANRFNDKSEIFLVKEPSVNRQPSATMDFLELRKQELKNQDIEKEREQIRQARERERKAEEERLKKQRELDRQAAAKTEALLTSTSPKSKTTPKDKSPVQKSPPSHIDIEPEFPQMPGYGRAKYSFHPQGPGELEFRKGDTIQVLRGIDENWVEGEHNGYVGIFPVSYVEFLEDPTPKQTNPQPKEKQQQHQHQSEEKKQVQPQEEHQRVEPKVNGFHTSLSDINGKMNGEPEIPSPQEETQPQVPQEYNIQEGLGRAKYTFKAEAESELSFKKGDMITILKQVDANWFEGELGNDIGIFPSNYIEVIEEPVVVALEPRTEKKKENNDLDFEKIFSDVLSQPLSPKALKQQQQQEQEPEVSAYEQNMNAMNDVHNQNGNHNDYHSYDEPTPPSVGGSDIDDLIGKGEPHRAVYQYNPTNDDEVELKIGDIVHVLEKCDDGWYIGTCERTGVFGTFPGNYVTLVS